MSASTPVTPFLRIESAAGLTAACNRNGSLRRLDYRDTILNLFLGNELEGGPTNVYLRNQRSGAHCPLLGPRSLSAFECDGGRITGRGTWQGIEYTVSLSLADSASAWFWQVTLLNTTAGAVDCDAILLQDIALSNYATVRLNEYYVSQYVDHTPLQHPTHGWVVAARQNLSVGGRNPWCVLGSLRRAVSFATDGLQWFGLAQRAGEVLLGLAQGLPGRRLQHEHSMICLQDAPQQIAPGAHAAFGFFGLLTADHPEATSALDLAHVDQAVKLAGASVPTRGGTRSTPSIATLFSAAPLLQTSDLDAAAVAHWFGTHLRHEERAADGSLLSFFCGSDRHVVLRAKELRVTRPHGHMLRSGRHTVPDETALTSTVWMAGVFHSMLTQGHVSFNRLLSTVHSYLGLFRSHGQRVFAEIDGGWQLLDIPSAFEMAPDTCRWLYRHAGGVIEVRSTAAIEPGELSLRIDVLEGPATRFLVTHHIALDGDDGAGAGVAHWSRVGDGIAIQPPAGSELAQRFAGGRFLITAVHGTRIEAIGGDELLFLDGHSRQQPYVCLVTGAAHSAGLLIEGQLVRDSADVPAADERTSLGLSPPTFAETVTPSMARIAELLPWLTHNAWVHYLSPRGLEQYSGGGWGTRDVSQGPVELLLARGDVASTRDLLLRVMSAQNADGDWPQWFMFFARERSIRASDSHGDIVFWPLLATAQYLIASDDWGLLDERVPFFDSASPVPFGEHVERSLQLIRRRVVQGTALAAYGHGDWNDALQPVDPAMREHMCSAWTVTLHYQVLTTLARAMRLGGRDDQADSLDAWAAQVRSDFQRVLLVDGVLTGYALFDGGQDVRYLLHPRDTVSGVRYSALAMIHAILEDLFTPEQARAHLAIIDAHLRGPDGVRLFDRPMPYHGGPQRFFQRAESATFFGREIGLMYMHAHLRYAQALAHMGEAERFYHALCQMVPIGLEEIVPTAAPRQVNCYYSSSDAAFADRYQASTEYERVRRGDIALEGGWRVYSSGAGIGYALVVRRLLGVTLDAAVLSIDPVMPASLNGLTVDFDLCGHPVRITYEVRAPGSGVSSVELNAVALPLSYAANPYRRGAAEVRRDAIVAQLSAQGNRLLIRVGG